MLIGHWLHYGDQSLVTEFLPTLRRWADYQLTRVRDGAVRDAPVSWGHDWLGLEQTPPELLHTGAALDALDSLADLELALGNDAECTRRRDQAAGLRRSARLTFHDPDRGTWGNGHRPPSYHHRVPSLEPRQATVFGANARRSLSALRPYDLRHAGVSTWLNSVVPSTKIEAWAGHSVDVLLKTYAKGLDGDDELYRTRIDAAPNRAGRPQELRHVFDKDTRRRSPRAAAGRTDENGPSPT